MPTHDFENEEVKFENEEVEVVKKEDGSYYFIICGKQFRFSNIPRERLPNFNRFFVYKQTYKGFKEHFDGRQIYISLHSIISTSRNIRYAFRRTCHSKVYECISAHEIQNVPLVKIRLMVKQTPENCLDIYELLEEMK